ncbi:pyocin activator PrtN family protein [Chromohalobacter israelensis]|uniref:pyocin activator PrtN family protein n=1 Tax=Chromohalobacter israelensis TaxID=141390 RepID=UPI003AF86BC4
MNTYFGLLAEFDGRAGDSQKATWLVSAVDLAKYLDERKAEAHVMWQRVNT